MAAAFTAPSGVVLPPPDPVAPAAIRPPSGIPKSYEPPKDDTHPIPLGGKIVVVGRFDLSMIDFGVADEKGANLRVQQISRLEAKELIDSQQLAIACSNDKEQTMVEKELGLEPLPRAEVTCGQRLLVVHRCVDWRDIRFYLVGYEVDAHGCVL